MRIPVANRSSDEMVRKKTKKTSGRHADGGHLTVEFSSYESGPANLRLTMECAGLHIARQEGMKNVVSHEGHQQKAFDGVGIPSITEKAQKVSRVLPFFPPVTSRISWPASTRVWMG
jgi:hypothetical protein